MEDADLLDRAAALKRLIFTQDDDFLVEASRRQASGEYFVGVLYQHQQATVIGQCINDLEVIAVVSELEEYANQVRYLPL